MSSMELGAIDFLNAMFLSKCTVSSWLEIGEMSDPGFEERQSRKRRGGDKSRQLARRADVGVGNGAKKLAPWQTTCWRRLAEVIG